MARPKLAQEIMTTEITMLESGANLLDAVLLMRTSGFRHLPVVEDGCPVGIVSDRDVQRASPSMFSNLSPDEYNQLFETTPIEKVMAKEPGIVTTETPIHEVVQLMCEQKFGSVLVVDGEKRLVGIVTTTDLLGVLHDLLGAS